MQYNFIASQNCRTGQNNDRSNVLYIFVKNVTNISTILCHQNGHAVDTKIL